MTLIKSLIKAKYINRLVENSISMQKSRNFFIKFQWNWDILLVVQTIHHIFSSNSVLQFVILIFHLNRLYQLPGWKFFSDIAFCVFPTLPLIFPSFVSIRESNLWLTYVFVTLVTLIIFTWPYRISRLLNLV